VYAGRPDAENPYRRQDYSRYVLSRPRKELPYFAVMAGWGMHLQEMGWPAMPRFFAAMTDTRRAFVASWDQRSSWAWRATPVHREIAAGRIDIRRDRPLPAFGHCSLDDNPGSGETDTGDPNGQINGYLLWDTDTIVDRPDGWEMTIWLDESAPKDDCSVDLTPRRCARFVPRPAERFAWANATGKGEAWVVGQSGRVDADRYGLVVLKGLVIGKARHRITIRRDDTAKGDAD